jgi:aspartate aminotransferase
MLTLPTSPHHRPTHPTKVNVAQGAYRTEEGLPLVLEAVRRAEQNIVADASLNKEYLGIEGHPAFNRLTAEFVFGDACPAIDAGRVATLQTLSGTGALRVAADWLELFAPLKAVWLPSPSWGNHAKIFERAGLTVASYRYLDDTGTGLDFDGLLDDLRGAPRGATILLHACAHNPSGVDLTAGQWRELAEVFRDGGLLPLFDSAYQVRKSRGGGESGGEGEAGRWGMGRRRARRRMGVRIVAMLPFLSLTP